MAELGEARYPDKHLHLLRRHDITRQLLLYSLAGAFGVLLGRAIVEPSVLNVVVAVSACLLQIVQFFAARPSLFRVFAPGIYGGGFAFEVFEATGSASFPRLLEFSLTNPVWLVAPAALVVIVVVRDFVARDLLEGLELLAGLYLGLIFLGIAVASLLNWPWLLIVGALFGAATVFWVATWRWPRIRSIGELGLAGLCFVIIARSLWRQEPTTADTVLLFAGGVLFFVDAMNRLRRSDHPGRH